ncbi:gamma-glutamyl-gamma-aminobutyrate hydrolase family protein [Candidatus Altiarchaeota archaeon]
MLLVIDNGSIHTSDLKKYLKIRNVRFVVAKKNSRLKTLMKHRFKGVILTGGHLVYNDKINIEDININLAALLDLDVPVLGICFGHQTIAEAFGGRVRKMKKTINRLEKIKVVKKRPIFQDLPPSFIMEEFHHDCICELPYNFELLAKSQSCRIEAIKHKKKDIYGVQFHPEASGEQGHKILDNFLNICKINYKVGGL